MPARSQPLGSAGRPHASRHIGVRGLTVLLFVSTGLVLAACGSSKPAYCSDRATLEKSVKELPGLVTSANLSGLRTQASEIQARAAKLTDSAKRDFPTESSAVRRDVDALVSSVRTLPPKPSTQDYAKVALDAATAVSSVSNLSRATNSKCT